MAEPGKKPGLLVALGLGKPGSKGPESAPEMDSGDDFDAAASEAFDALKEGDLEGFKLALRTAVMAASDSESDTDI